MRILPFALILLTFHTAYASGIEFFHGSWEEALAEAKAQDKLIFVDAYTTWCGPCKRMAAQVFPDAEVGSFYNASFVALKIDMEKEMGIQFRQTYPVSAYPTLLYIDYDGTLVQKVKGAQTVQNFIQIGKNALQKIDRSGQFEERYAAGDRDPELVYQYVKALNQAGKPSGVVVNDYLRDQTDLTTPQNLRFLLAAVGTVDSRAYDLMDQHHAAILKQEGAEAVAQRIERAARATAARALEFESEDLLELAKAATKKYAPTTAAAFAARADLGFYRAQGDVKKFLKGAQAYERAIAKDDPVELHRLAKQTFEAFPQERKVLQFAEKAAARSVQNSTDYRHYYTYAEILLATGNTADAKRIATEGLEKATGGARRAMQALLQKIARA